MRVARVAGWVAAVVSDLAETIEIQLPNEASDIARLEDGPTRIQVFRLESLIIKQYGVAVRTPTDCSSFALVHYPPELLRKSHRLQYAILVHPCGCH